MKIQMSKELYNRLIKLCKKLKVEVSGVMEHEINGKNIIIKDISYDTDCIESTNENEIIYNIDKYYDKTVDEMKKQKAHIRFHTHPAKSSPAILSDTDKKHTQGRSSISKLVSKIQKRKPLIIIDCVINRYEAAFYLYVEKTKENIRIPLLVDGKEKKPLIYPNPMHNYYQNEGGKIR